MTVDEEARLWQAEMTANRDHYAKWLKRTGRPAHESPAVARSRDLIRDAHEIVAVSKELRSRNR